MTRINNEELLAPNYTISITLSHGTYRDIDGDPLSSFILSFTTAGIDIEEVAANPGKRILMALFSLRAVSSVRPPGTVGGA